MKPRHIKEWFFDMLPVERRSSGDWLLPMTLGVGFGVAAGIGIGVLLAPRPGVETRERLREGAETLREKARDLAGRAKGQLANATQQLGSTGYTSEISENR